MNAANISGRGANQHIKLAVFANPLPVVRLVKSTGAKIKPNGKGLGLTNLQANLGKSLPIL